MSDHLIQEDNRVSIIGIRPLSCENLEHDQPEGPLVHALIVRLICQCFWAHIARRSHGACHHQRSLDCPRKMKVANANLATAAKKQIGGLEIPALHVAT